MKVLKKDDMLFPISAEYIEIINKFKSQFQPLPIISDDIWMNVWSHLPAISNQNSATMLQQHTCIYSLFFFCLYSNKIEIKPKQEHTCIINIPEQESSK